MNKVIFIFIASFFLIISVLAGVGQIDLTTQSLVSIAFVFLLGIPHGAIDHILFMEERQINPISFYGLYLGLMGVYLLCWIWMPVWSLVFFLLLSAYHFGQSQLSDITTGNRKQSIVLYFAWGISILSAMIWYNRVEISEIAALYPDLDSVMLAFDMPLYQILVPVSTVVVLLVLAYQLWQKEIEPGRFFMELYVLALIHFSFAALPLLIGFTLYFVILHAMKVMDEEFTYLSLRRDGFSVFQFIKLLTPYSLLSLVGVFFIYLLSQNLHYFPSEILLFFILISILTLPHSIVMDLFYKNYKRTVGLK